MLSRCAVVFKWVSKVRGPQYAWRQGSHRMLLYLFWDETTNCILGKKCQCFGTITTNGVHTQNTSFRVPTNLSNYSSSIALKWLGIGRLYNTTTRGLVYPPSKETFLSLLHPYIVSPLPVNASALAYIAGIHAPVISLKWSSAHSRQHMPSLHASQYIWLGLSRSTKGFVWHSHFQLTLLLSGQTVGLSPS